MATMADDLRTDLDQLLLQAPQRPVFDRLERRERAQEIAKVVGQRKKLEPDGVGGERPARQPCPLDRAFTFFDPLLAGPALVVERHNPFGRARQVGDADARIKLTGVPLDFGDHPAWFGPASRLIGEIGIEPTHLVGRSADRALQQVANPMLQDLVGG